VNGYFGIGITHAKYEVNLGTLWRSAFSLGASFIFIVGPRFTREASDTTKSWRSIPLFRYQTFDQFYDALPYDCQLIGVELVSGAERLETFSHPNRCLYLLGAEDHGIPGQELARCHRVVVLPGSYCMNVAVAGSIVMYDRLAKRAALADLEGENG
jgi:tRNA G18 (ribose-2'-O)-methylase SpoU